MWPLPDDLSAYYPEEYSAYIAPLVEVGLTRPWHKKEWELSFGAEGMLRSAARNRLKVNEIARLLWQCLDDGYAPQSFLDYGSGTGRALRFAEQLGMKAVGVDASDNTLEAARATGLDLRVGSYENLPLQGETFDVIHLSHVLEHVVEPVEALTALRTHMSDRGRILVMVPNAGSGLSDLFGADWFQLDAPRHLWGLTPHSLELAMERAGFSVVKKIFNGAGHAIYESMRYALERSGSSHALPEPPNLDVLAGFEGLASYWNAQEAGDAMIMVGKVKE
ncbi:MAG: class I SAM-dependent methyltransferase [Coriobacteriia bacterium]